MTRTLKGVALLVLVQGVLVLAYLQLKKPGNADHEAPLSIAEPSRVERAFPTITVENRRGDRFPLPLDSRPTIVHIWATWCPPCRAELPGLLALDRQGQKVFAVAMDPDWNDIEEFFSGEVPPEVVLGDPDELRGQLRTTTLPVTFFVSRGGSAYLRFDGARDWQSETFRKRWLE